MKYKIRVVEQVQIVLSKEEFESLALICEKFDWVDDVGGRDKLKDEDVNAAKELAAQIKAIRAEIKG